MKTEASRNGDQPSDRDDDMMTGRAGSPPSAAGSWLRIAAGRQNFKKRHHRQQRDQCGDDIDQA